MLDIDTKRVGTEEPSKYTWAHEIRWYCSHFHWFHFGFLVFLQVPIYILSRYVSLVPKTFWLAVALHISGGWCITAGYHRGFSHGSFRPNPILKLFIAVMGAGEMQWSIMWWVRHHRAHHRYTDTSRDPYNARRGFLFSHIGWLIGYNPAIWGPVDISDLQNDPLVVWQQKYYVYLAIAAGILLPMSIAHFGWNDWLGGAVYASGYRITFTLHSTFLVNSLSHASWAGKQPYSTADTSRDVPFVALIAGGEGTHNFHHMFPTDYRHGTKWTDLDYTGTVIELLHRIGLVSDLKTIRDCDIEKARLLRQGRLEVGDAPGISGLPEMTWNEYAKAITYGRILVIVNGVVHDVSQYMTEHPGGRHLIQSFVGKDASEAFFNGDHCHSLHAEAVLARFRIAIIAQDR